MFLVTIGFWVLLYIPPALCVYQGASRAEPRWYLLALLFFILDIAIYIALFGWAG